MTFCPQINVKGFLKLILSFYHFKCVARHAEITQNNEFAISLKKEASDEVAEKHENLLQIDTMIFMGLVKHSQSSQKSKFAMSLNNI